MCSHATYVYTHTHTQYLASEKDRILAGLGGDGFGDMDMHAAIHLRAVQRRKERDTQAITPLI
jgi:hypothetical protein